ncbi:MAG: flagellar export chaperone FliS [Spirochaetales bacterium]|nr:flagellar export chaperone FliS [Spirochaetales bacterium]
MNKMDPVHSYRETQIKTATPGKLILMLYDGAIKYINLASENIDKKFAAYDKVSSHIIRTQDIVTELMVSLDFEKGGEIARSLFSLYMYMNRKLLEANIKKDTKLLGEVKKLLMELRSAWAEVANKAGAEQNQSNSTGINIAG